MGSVLHVRLFTPERLLLELEAAEVIAPGSLGEFGLLPNHINFASSLGQGRLALRTTVGERQVLAVYGGYLEVTDDTVTVLADGAEMAEDIDGRKAQEELTAAERQLAGLEVGSAVYRDALSSLAVAQARVAAVSDHGR